MGIALPPNIETGRKVNLDYPMVAADIFATSLAPQLEKGKRFRFVYVSGTLAVRDQEEKLWFGQEGRRLRVGSVFTSLHCYVLTKAYLTSLADRCF